MSLFNVLSHPQMEMICDQCISFLGPGNKVPQTRCLKTTEVCSLTVLESGSLKSKCWQRWFFLEALFWRRICSLLPSQLLVAAGNPCCSLSCQCISLISASIFIWHSSVGLRVSTHLSSFTLYGHRSLDWGQPCSNVISSYLITCAKSYF